MAEVRIERRGEIAVIMVDNPPVHALATPVRAGILAAVRELEADASVAAVVIATAGRTFIAGADLRELDGPPQDPILPEVTQAIARCKKPYVAALHGHALGGGFEIALACRGRVAARGTSVGLPEVRVGVVPGAGGSQRLLRLVDFATAARMITSGKAIGVDEALRLGLIHRITDGDVLDAAIAFAADLAAGRDGGVPAPAAIEARAAAQPDPALLRDLKAEVLKSARGAAAPVAALDMLEQTARAPFATGAAEERAVYVYLRSSREAKALRRLFLAEREAGRLPEIAAIQPRRIDSVGVVGAGLMGCGIAFASLAAGCRVTLAEANDEALARARARMSELMDGAVKSGKLQADKRATMDAALMWTTDFSAFADRDLVIEAVVEDMALKQEVFRRLDTIVRPDALLASNTSYLDLDAIASATRDPARVLGLHFFSPAHVMRLLEVVRGARTAPEALAAGVAFGRRLGKIPVVTGVCEGFCGNRILKAYRSVAEEMVEDGASPAAIDAAMTEFGFPMGPFAVQDMAGLEIAFANRKQRPALRSDGKPLGLVEMLVEAGRLGRKSGKGWHAYPDGGRVPVRDPEAEAMIENYRVRQQIPHRAFSPDAIRTALLGAMRAEGQAILREGIVARPEDIDLVMVNGYGFPAHKGGPMFGA